MAQEAQTPILISAQGTVIKASLTGNNEENLLTLVAKKKDDKLVIMNGNSKKESKLIRKYMLMSASDEDIAISFTGRVVGTVGASLQEIFAKTKKGNTYSLYTIATPTDPKQAALVRVRRILLCKIVIK
jgi:hypothetical protein